MRLLVLALSLTLVACTAKTPIDAGPSPRATMVHVAKQVQLCWFKSKDPTFNKFRMASEVNSHTGKPRILIVPRNNPGGLPVLVAQAERRGGATQFTSFGPLLQQSEGPRLQASLSAWFKGSRSC